MSIIYFNPVHMGLRATRDREPGAFEGSVRLDLLYEEDVATVTAHQNVEKLIRAAARNAEPIRSVLGGVGAQVECAQITQFC